MKGYLFGVLVLLFPFSRLSAQEVIPYQIFTSSGKPVAFKKLAKAAEEADIVLFGEYHNNAIAHWLQYELTSLLIQSDKPLVLGAEMFEADNQTALTAYITGEIDAKTFAEQARLWNNFNTDYKPLADLAKTFKRPFVATNIPRKYASQVFRAGLESLDTLSAMEKSWIAPLPIAYDASLPGYQAMLEMGGGHGGDNLPKAQAIKDATMAHFILSHFAEGQRFIHYNGAYHSDNYEGILWYLKRQSPNLKYLTISTVSQDDVSRLLPENKGRADFIICVDSNMTNTY